MVKWYDQTGIDGGIAISTRVRLARNLKGYPFAGKISKEQEREVIRKVADAMGSIAGGMEFKFINLAEENSLEAGSLMERHLVSPELVQKRGERGVILSRDESVSVMVLEEDHIRIQALGSGFCPSECLKKADDVDNFLEEKFPFAFDERLGYLTSCPTNLGTGMRVSVMLHLPAFTGTGEIMSMITAVSKFGLTVRGLYGEGTDAKGSLYQISNQLTLGISEEETVERLSGVVKNIIDRERELREKLYKSNSGFKDRLWRCVGTMASARRMGTNEMLLLLSDIRMGVEMGELSGITTEELNRLMWEMQPYSLRIKAEDTLMSTEEGEDKRAEILRPLAMNILKMEGLN